MKGRDSNKTERPYLERWNWVQFTCAFVWFGFISFLSIGADWGLGLHLLKTLLVAVGCGCLAGRYGDEAWHALARLCGWL